MSEGKLTSLQWRILRELATLSPPWTLTGGAALVGFHLGHRTTRLGVTELTSQSAGTGRGEAV